MTRVCECGTPTVYAQRCAACSHALRRPSDNARRIARLKFEYYDSQPRAERVVIWFVGFVLALWIIAIVVANWSKP